MHLGCEIAWRKASLICIMLILFLHFANVRALTLCCFALHEFRTYNESTDALFLEIALRLIIVSAVARSCRNC
jgi:hypothetical protein